jgi:FERM/RhoGEF/pleckstrin domain-containing protein 1
MGETEQKPTPGSRLGAPENSGISTLERGQKPPPTPSGKLMSIKIQMLDDTQEAFEVPVSWGHVWEPMCGQRLPHSQVPGTGGTTSLPSRNSSHSPIPGLSNPICRIVTQMALGMGVVMTFCSRTCGIVRLCTVYVICIFVYLNMSRV